MCTGLGAPAAAAVWDSGLIRQFWYVCFYSDGEKKRCGRMEFCSSSFRSLSHISPSFILPYKTDHHLPDCVSLAHNHAHTLGLILRHQGQPDSTKPNNWPGTETNATNRRWPGREGVHCALPPSFKVSWSFFLLFFFLFSSVCLCFVCPLQGRLSHPRFRKQLQLKKTEAHSRRGRGRGGGGGFTFIRVQEHLYFLRSGLCLIGGIGMLGETKREGERGWGRTLWEKDQDIKENRNILCGGKSGMFFTFQALYLQRSETSLTLTFQNIEACEDSKVAQL